jgi:hypothetical protein
METVSLGAVGALASFCPGPLNDREGVAARAQGAVQGTERKAPPWHKLCVIRYKIKDKRTYRVCAGLRGFCFIVFVSSFFFGVFSFFFADSSSASYYREMGLRMQRRFTLVGSLELTYERQWFGGMSQAAHTEFTESLNFGVYGFAVDPRLVNFKVSGILSSSQYSPGGSSSFRDVSINVMLLQTIPWRWLRYWEFIPSPIMLRYNRYWDTDSLTNYGVSLTFKKPQGLRGYPFFPRTVFDYDHYDFTSATGTNSTSNFYSLRSSLQGKTYNYTFLAEKLDGGVNSRDTVQLEPDYRFYDPKTGRVWDILNSLKYERINNTKSYQGQSQVSYSRPMGDSGRDLLLVGGNLNFLKFTGDGTSTSTYYASATATYQMSPSPGLFVAPYAAMGYSLQQSSDTGQETGHFERAGSTIGVELSRIFRNDSAVFMGNNQSGLVYGVSTMFSTKTRIRTSAQYSLSTTSFPDGNSSSQRFVLRASGPLRGRLSFDSLASYTMQDSSRTWVNGTGSPSLEYYCDGLTCTGYVPKYASSGDSLTAAANLYWSFGVTSVSAGGACSRTKTKDGVTETVTTSMLQASLSRPVARRTFFNVVSLWTSDSRKNETIEVRPRLVWSRGRTSVNVDYDYRRTSTLGAPTVAAHRLFVRFVRYFSRGFRL